MSATTSAATGRCFGIQRVCQVWERSRSALYARRARAHHRLGAGPARRGPPPRQSDAQLLAAIRTDLARSPPRRRPSQGPRTASDPGRDPRRPHAGAARHAGARTALPARGRQGAAKTHDGRVITQAPNVMWGTDGVRVFTLDDGWGWIFAQSNTGTRSAWGGTCAKSEAASRHSIRLRGLERLYGSLDADVARGLALRMDHGSQPVRPLPQANPVLGDPPQLGFVEEPETNGVAERWNRTLKEQAIHGRIFQNLEAVRAAVADFVVRYPDLASREAWVSNAIEARRSMLPGAQMSREPGAVQGHQTTGPEPPHAHSLLSLTAIRASVRAAGVHRDPRRRQRRQWVSVANSLLLRAGLLPRTCALSRCRCAAGHHSRLTPQC